MSKPVPFYLSMTAGVGLTLMMIALGIGVVQGSEANSTVVGLTFAGGLGLLVLGIAGWLAAVQPFRNFDDINVPQYTGHHAEHHAADAADHESHEEHAEQPVLPHG
jgi:ABC-type nickel/cobalt efflux system permease component RcnA